METVNTIARFLHDGFNVSFVLLFLLLWLAWHIIRSSQATASVWADVFNDENGKRSALRVAILIAVAVHSAVLLYLVTTVVSATQASVKDALDGLIWHVGLYAAVWSGAPVAAKFLDVLLARFAPAKTG